MMIVPQKLRQNSEVRVISPSRSMSLLSKDITKLAVARFEKQGLKVTFSKHCMRKGLFDSTPIESRIEDLHQAFLDKKVKAIISTFGGFNSNQLLNYIDYPLIKDNPKIFCGYSDITALANAITSKTQLITYSGPNFSNWGMKKNFDYSLEYFRKCLFGKEAFQIKASEHWSDDAWYINQENREIIENKGFVILNEGEAEGTIFGGNLCTFNLLQGTEFMPNISNSVLFLEEDVLTEEHFMGEFDRNLQSLLHQPNFDKVKGIVFGRFQRNSNMNLEKLNYIINKKELKNIPIIADVDFGHTTPSITFPIGGTVQIKASDKIEIRIMKH